MDEKKQNLIELAKKKRHIALVEKLTRGTLSSKELKELEEFEKENRKDTDEIIDGTVDLPTMSVYLEKSPRMVRRYIKQGMPVIRDSKGEIFRFKVAEVFKWYYGMQGLNDDGKEYWDNEYRKNKAKLSEIELKQKKGELILLTEHEGALREMLRGIKAGFLWLPRYLAPKLYQQEPKAISEILDHELRNIINQFSRSSRDKEIKSENN
jgi:hypothetical protein